MTLVWFLIAAFAEIAGCFAFWGWARLDRSPLWLIAGLASLALFAWILTRADSALAGRAYAAYARWPGCGLSRGTSRIDGKSRELRYS